MSEGKETCHPPAAGASAPGGGGMTMLPLSLTVLLFTVNDRGSIFFS